MKRRRCLLFIVFVVTLIILVIPLNTNASRKSNLLDKIKNTYPIGTVYKTWYQDFDGNGSKELFALLENYDYGYTLCFASDKETRKLVFTGMLVNGYGPCKINKKQKLFIMEADFGGSGSKSYCYCIKSGKVKSVLDSGSHLKRKGKTGRQFLVVRDAFDSIRGDDGISVGHTYKVYYLKWTGKKFKEYVGTKITQKAFKKYKGAAAILKRAKKEGYKIGQIFKRKNGIINVNLYRYDDYNDKYNDNLTLKISGKKVKLIKINPMASSWIKTYSYGGDYAKSMALDH